MTVETLKSDLFCLAGGIVGIPIGHWCRAKKGNPKKCRVENWKSQKCWAYALHNQKLIDELRGVTKIV